MNPLALIRSPWAQALAGIVAFLIWLHFHDAKVTASAKAECQEEHLRATIEEITRQLRHNEAVVADAEKQEAVTTAEMAELKRQKDATDAENAKLKNGCRVPAAVRKRLRDIR